MEFSEWEPVYGEILRDFGFSRAEDENCVRILKAVTVNSLLDDDDAIRERIGRTATVVGAAPGLAERLGTVKLEGTVISAGSATKTLMDAGILPDIVVTDLDGDIESQLEASAAGAVTLIHAHGDNEDLVRRYAGLFRGTVVLTTQSKPSNTVLDFGGFTDGDRAVCMAREFGARFINLVGFDFDNPSDKEGSDPETKRRKLKWAKRIIFDMEREKARITVI